MKRTLQLTTLIALGILAYLLWDKKQDPQPVEEPVAEIPTAIEKINKKIPEKLFPTPTPKKEVKKTASKKEETSIQMVKPKLENEILPEDEIEIHIQAPNGDLIITTVTVVDDMVIAHGDIMVGQIDSIDDFLERAKSGKPMILPLPKLWEEGTVPYAIDDNLTNADAVKDAIDVINQTTNTKWIPRTNEKDYVRFRVGAINCYSPLGKIGGEQFITLSEGCTKGTVMHEMLHTLGLLHEQNREDRDEHIRILWENIDPKNHLQFQKIKQNSLNLEDHPFDFSSIMLYSQSAFSKYQGDFTIIRVDGDTYYPGKEGLSLGDMKKLDSLYPKKN